MIISNAWIGMAAQHEYREEHKVTEHLGFWRAQPDQDQLEPEPPKQPILAELVELPAPEADFSEAGSLLAMYRTQQVFDLNTHMDSRSRLNLMILESLYKAITGTELKITTPGELQSEMRIKVNSLNVDTPPPARVVSARSATPNLVYQRHERYRENENMSFQAAGVVRTADGKEMSFSVALHMSREFVQESNLQVTKGAQKVDPLVINFDGLGTSLSQTRFAFDLDSDGTTEQIATLRPGSGYLALDKNADGEINNGNELFGPTSGRGFAELSAYDEDGNHFIDEADSIYEKLRIWIMNEDGSTQLFALGDKNVGAIFLGHVSSPFQLNNEQNNSLGEVANSGIYLTEEGKTGVVQEINLSV